MNGKRMYRILCGREVDRSQEKPTPAPLCADAGAAGCYSPEERDLDDGLPVLCSDGP